MEDNKSKLEKINAMCRNTMMEALEMECIEIGDNSLKVRMPITDASRQPLGLLHGGATAALVESIGSMGSVVFLDTEKEVPLGVEVNANHLSGVSSGHVIATGKLLHKGGRTHVWQVDVHHEETGKLVAVGRLTVLVIQKK